MSNYLTSSGTRGLSQANDAFSNPAARMGFGTASIPEATSYQMVRWSNDYWLLLTLFRNHWIARRIVEIPPHDMTKHWAKITGQMDPKDMTRVEALVTRTYTPAKVRRALTWAELYGGAGALITISGHENILDQPLDLDEVGPGSYKGLIVFDRWSGIIPGLEVSYDMDRPLDFGLPEYYEIIANGTVSQRIHSSRILRFTGPEVPSPEYEASQRWGISRLEVIFEELRKRDNMSWSILQLLFRAQLLVRKEPELAALLSGLGSSTAAAQKFATTMQAQNELISNQSTLILGKDAELQSHQYTFGGMAEIYAQFQLDICGAAEMTVSELFGRTATGLSATNEDDLRQKEERTKRRQQDQLKPQLDKLYPVLCMSALGEVPADMDIMFPSIRVMTEEEKANLAKSGTEAILAPYNAGIDGYGSQIVLRELRQMSDRTGIGTNITDEIIESATNDDRAEAMEMGSEFDDDKPKEDDHK